MIVVAKNLSVLQLFISRMPKMCAILQLVSAPLNPIPIAEHFRRSHPQCEHSCANNLRTVAAIICAKVSGTFFLINACRSDSKSPISPITVAGAVTCLATASTCELDDLCL